MMNPSDLNTLNVSVNGGDPAPTPVALVHAYSICPGVLSLHEAVHKLTNDDPEIPIITKNGGPLNKELGDVHPIWAGLYMLAGSKKVCVIYEDDLNTVGLPDDFAAYGDPADNP